KSSPSAPSSRSPMLTFTHCQYFTATRTSSCIQPGTSASKLTLMGADGSKTFPPHPENRPITDKHIPLTAYDISPLWLLSDGRHDRRDHHIMIVTSTTSPS